VKVFGFSSPLWKRGAGGDFIIKIKPLISVPYCFIKSPSTPLFQRGRSKKKAMSSLSVESALKSPLLLEREG